MLNLFIPVDCVHYMNQRKLRETRFEVVLMLVFRHALECCTIGLIDMLQILVAVGK